MLFLWLALLVLCVLHLYQCYRLRNRPPLVDGAWPIIGHSLLALKNLQFLIDYTTDDSLEKGIGIATVKLAAWDITVVLDPEDSLVLANSSTTKDAIYELLKPYFGEGLITANGSKWGAHRRLLSSCFNQQVLDGYLLEFNKGAKKLVQALDIESGMGPFDHCTYLDHSILSTVCVTTIGTVMDDEDKHTMECFMNAKIKFYNCLLQRVLKFWLQSDLIYFLSGLRKEEKRHAIDMNALSRAILKKKRAEFETKKNTKEGSKSRFISLMDHLLELADEGELSEKDVTDQVNTFIAAGSDTISVAMPYVLLCVGSYPKVQQRIFEELQTVFEGSARDVEKQDLQRLKYLEAVIKETLRLYPSVSLIGRTLEKDVQIKKYTIPAGSKCYIDLYGVLRHPTWGPDATEFRPERWLDGTLPTNHKVFAAFGMGKRTCVGINFTLMLMKTYLSTIFRRYAVSGDVTKLVKTFEILSRPVSGHYISIKIRK